MGLVKEINGLVKIPVIMTSGSRFRADHEPQFMIGARNEPHFPTRLTPQFAVRSTSPRRPSQPSIRVP